MVVRKSSEKVRLLKRFRYVMILFILLLLAYAADAQTTDTAQWYQSGSKEIWFHQKDVFAFRTKSLTAFEIAGYDDVVKHHYHRSRFPDKMNIVYFDTEASTQQVEDFKQYIKTETDFDAVFPVITKMPDSLAEKAKWLLVDDYIMIKFRNNNISTQQLNDFRTKYALLWRNPEIKNYNSGNPTYLFTFNMHSGKAIDVIDLSKKIIEQDSVLVAQAIPNKIMAFEPIPADANNTITFIVNQTNTEGKDYYIHLNSANILKVYFKNREPSKKKEFKIYNAMGQLIYDKPVSQYEQNEYYLRVHDYAPGIYFTLIEETGGNMIHFARFKKD